MLCPTPIRKDKTPFIGSRVLDGRTSEFDWEGLVPAKDLPRSINPERGYIVTANNRQAPENSLYDYGANNMPTGRANRIDEMINNKIKSGEKFKLADLGEIQQDVTDVYAREMAPMIVQIARSMLDELSIHDRREATKQVEYLENFTGDMVTDSVAPTVYMYW
jgi:penicillin amidase